MAKLPRITVHLDPDTLDWLMLQASIEKRSISQMAAMYLDECLRREESPGTLTDYLIGIAPQETPLMSVLRSKAKKEKSK